MPNPVFFDKHWWFNFDGPIIGPYATADDAWAGLRAYLSDKFPNVKIEQNED
jgi:hypothetical protein